MLIWENYKKKFIQILKTGMNPFKRFVATGEIKESLGLVKSRKPLMENIINELLNEGWCAVIGRVGIGKTHLYWALKKNLGTDYNMIYISLDNIYKRFFYNLYSEFIDELGIRNLRSITNDLCNKWNGIKKKYGLFPIPDIENAKKNAFKEWNDEFKNKNSLEDIINVITAHQLDPYKKIEAENYLLGELMNIRELSLLNVNNDLRKKDNAFTMLKVLIEHSELKTVIFIDDFEKILSLMRPEEETEVVFDSSWLYGAEETPESIAAKKVLNKIIRLQEIEGLKIIITLNSVNSLEEIKELVSEKDKNFLNRFKKPQIITRFLYEDIYEFYKSNIRSFLKEINYGYLMENIENPYFPINEKILKNIYDQTDGNPREIIKKLIKIFNEVIYNDESIQKLVHENDIL